MSEGNSFEEYKLFVEDTARFSERRQTITNTYISVNGVILGAITLLVKDAGLTNWWLVFAMLPLIAAGVMVSIYWHQLVIKYKQLVGLRLDVLREMEEKMPGSIQMYHREDRLYPRDTQGRLIPGQGLNFSDREASLPILFIILYIVMIVGLILATALVAAGVVSAPITR